MINAKKVTVDGNEAVARVAHKLNEVIAIYPITPSSPMGEHADDYSARDIKNIWGTVPQITEMQSEGGAAAAVHGALQTGALSTTFTASQGLLLMIPNMYKIAGELTPTVFHIAARSLAAQALSIFGDHADVMAARGTGFVMLGSANVQEAQDFALVSQAATLKSRLPFVHFFDGFRTSHEVNKIDELPESVMREMIDDELVFAHRSRAIRPEAPVLRGTAMNPDVYFQGRETVNPYYAAVPAIIQKEMDIFAEKTGRAYRIYEYTGPADAERVIVIMGSGAEVVSETIHALAPEGEKVGLITVRLFRPFDSSLFVSAIPSTVQSIAVLDRTKEPGASGEPLYQDVQTAFMEAFQAGSLSVIPRIIGGRYGLSSKEFTPAMVKAIYDELAKEKPKNHFTVGIHDDVSHTSLDYDTSFTIDTSEFRGLFYGLGSDGTVSANKNSIKIIGEMTDNYAQGYFVYDSKKSGSLTISHVRFGKHPIKAPYLIERPNFVAVHHFKFLFTLDALHNAEQGATFLLNSHYPADDVWDKIPARVQKQIIDKKIKFYVIDAGKVAENAGMGRRINTVMQTAFFAISGFLSREESIAKIKEVVHKTFIKRGEEIVRKNHAAIDAALSHLEEVKVPDHVTSEIHPILAYEPKEGMSDFVKKVTLPIMAGLGDNLPVSAIPADGTWPTGTAKYDKLSIAEIIPVWEEDICIQCGKCSLVCPHSAIRIKVYDKEILSDAPDTFKHTKPKGKEFSESEAYTIQVAPEDCTGCELCVDACPAKSKTDAGKRAINMEPQRPLVEEERKNWDFFLDIPEIDRSRIEKKNTVRGVQFMEPLFEFSGACPGCGETPYLSLITRLFGDRMMVANATGCSSIYGGNLPTTPWTKNKDGYGPAWNNSLFEDNAEFGLGYRLTVNQKENQAREILTAFSADVGDLASEILNASQSTEEEIVAQRNRVAELKKKLENMPGASARHLHSLADYLVKKSIWIIGGDGWAYDIGYGGLDHVLASGQNVNILVLDTEVYSNTGGQMSKATPLGAVAKFAASGKRTGKKDLFHHALDYGNVYVARIAMGASDAQTVKAITEAEAYNGVSLIIAYSHCIAHGYDLKYGNQQQKLAVDSGYWPLMRYNPLLKKEGKNPFVLDSAAGKVDLGEFMERETRFKILSKMDPQLAEELYNQAKKAAAELYRSYEHLASAPEVEKHES